MTRRESAIVGAFTGVLAGPFGAMQEYADEKFGRSTYTHEFGDKDFAARLKEMAKEDFIAMAKGVV